MSSPDLKSSPKEKVRPKMPRELKENRLRLHLSVVNGITARGAKDVSKYTRLPRGAVNKIVRVGRPLERVGEEYDLYFILLLSTAFTT